MTIEHIDHHHTLIPVDTGRRLPADEAAERAVLKALILAGSPGTPEAVHYDDILSTGLTPADYYWPAHATIHTAIVTAHDAGEPVDEVTVRYELGRMNELGRPAEVLLELAADGVTLAQNGEHYARIVREKTRRRHILTGATRLQQLARDEAADFDQIEQTLTEIVTGIPGVTTAPPTIGETWDDFLIELEALQAGERSGIAYGYPDLDEVTSGGMKPGNVTVVAAGSGEGKSTLALNMGINAAKAGAKVMFSSLEMSRFEVTAKVIAAEKNISLKQLLHDHELTNEGWAKVRELGPALIRDLGFRIDQPEGATLGDITSAARAARRADGLDVLVVDYLQLVEIETRNGANREQAVAAISRGLKNLAVALECHVIALSQLNADGMMRESRAIKNDASVVIKVERQDDEGPRSGEADLKVEKNRFGRAGVDIAVAASLHYSRFDPMGS